MDVTVTIDEDAPSSSDDETGSEASFEGFTQTDLSFQKKKKQRRVSYTVAQKLAVIKEIDRSFKGSATNFCSLPENAGFKVSTVGK